MKKWFMTYAPSIEAFAAILTAIFALAALIGIKYQLDAADELQRSQSARDAYRSHLALAVNQPQFSKPNDVCDMLAGTQSGAYTAFVDHLLYSAEQMLEVEPGWETTFQDALYPHRQYMCSREAPSGGTEYSKKMLISFTNSVCSSVEQCSR